MTRRLLIGGLLIVMSLVARQASAASILYGANGSGGAASSLYTIDPTTGNATLVGAIGFSVTGLAFDPTTGILYGGTSSLAAASQLITIDPLTGAGTLVGNYGAPGDQAMSDITFDAAGNLYGFLEPVADDLYRIDKATGAATLVGNSPSSAVSGLAFAPDGTLYLENAGILQILDPATGLLVSTVGNANLSVGMGMDFSDTGVLFALERVTSGASGIRNLVTVNLATGAATTVGSTLAGLDALAFAPAAPAAVPEPASMLLLGSGLAGLAAKRARRRRS